ncbi:MAG: ferredoxin-thioredoxin reductase catalytic domain-containing protein [Elusimicrobiaceae bacterium]|nr:ferredoxin-thioredoxin reductase catalytic domain-containing protein [Elusimicrobiaceae bacterium]
MTDIDKSRLAGFYRQLQRQAQDGGYFLNPDSGFAMELAESLLINQNRYGYQACPCRLADGERELDQDIICPCDYRDEDLGEYGACYCALYVSKEVAERKKQAGSIPERRPPDPADRAKRKPVPSAPGTGLSGLAYPVWRCRVCGYLAARDTPPGVCPVCHAEKDRFELFMPGGNTR